MSKGLTGTDRRDVQALRHKTNTARTQVAGLRQKLDILRWEAETAALGRDKALYWLLRLCEAAEREKWTVSAETSEAIEHALDLLFEHNIVPGLDEPDHATLRLMEIVTLDLEGKGEGEGGGNDKAKTYSGRGGPAHS